MSADTVTDSGLKVKKLIFVEGRDGANDNKYYNMTERSDGTFLAEYGRVDKTRQTKVYSMSKWNSTLSSKLRKGYEDKTELFAEPTEEEKKGEKKDIFDLANAEVKRIMKLLNGYSTQSVQQNYKISSEKVTIKMVEEAQEIIDQIVGLIKEGTKKDAVNEKLLALYKVIPRSMQRVSDYLLDENITKANLQEAQRLIGNEQDTLDVMRGQVNMNVQKNDDGEESDEDRGTILDIMGIAVEPVTDDKTIQMIKKKMGPEANMFKSAFRVKNSKTYDKFDKYRSNANNDATELFWHGSRNENWLSIMGGGLVLRPANAVITGKMFGWGTYFADKFRKSLGYTSHRGSYWARGSADKAFLALYSVHVGEQYHIKKWQHSHSQLTEDKLKQLGDYDSVYAHGGADLRNNEYIVYNEAQTTIEYLVEIE